MTADQRPTWLTLAEAAGYLRVSPSTIRRAVRAGRLRVAVLGSSRGWRFSARWLDDFAEHAAAPVQAAIVPASRKIA
jgi:excisionase family DNA binding protein